MSEKIKSGRSSSTELTKLLKLIFSSLFARKVPYLIIGCKPKHWIFTNAHPSEIEIGRHFPNHVFHDVEFKSNMYDCVLEKFPILNTVQAFVELKEFLLICNKSSIDNLVIELNESTLFIKDITTSESKEIGFLLQDFLVLEYLKSITIEDIPEEDLITSDLTSEDIHRSDLWFKTVYTKPTGSLDAIVGQVKVPIKDGESLISCNEYIKKSKKDYQLRMHTWLTEQVIKVFYIFENEDINVTSYNPYNVYFPIPISL